MMVSNSPGLIVLMPKLSDPRKSLTLNVTIGDPATNRHLQNTIIVGVRQHRTPAEIDLDKSRSAAQVLYKIIDIIRIQTQLRNSTLEHGLVFERQRRRNHWSPLPFLNRLQETVRRPQTGPERSQQHIRINHDLDHI